MFLDGKPVCCFREGAKKTTEKVTLAQGMVPITLIGTVFNRGAVSVEWQPPGQAALSEIPAERLFCDPNEAAAREQQMTTFESKLRTSLPKPVKVNVGRYQPGLVVQTYADCHHNQSRIRAQEASILRSSRRPARRLS